MNGGVCVGRYVRLKKEVQGNNRAEHPLFSGKMLPLS